MRVVLLLICPLFLAVGARGPAGDRPAPPAAPDPPNPGASPQQPWTLPALFPLGKLGPSLGGTDSFPERYSKFLDTIVERLEDLVNRTESPSQADLDRVACANGLNSFSRHIGTSWGIKMLDAATKFQSGLLQGNLHDLGQFDECVRIAVSADPEDPFTADFTGQHCLISFNIHLPGDTMQLNGKEEKLVELFGYDWIPLELGQCVPSLCKSYVLEEAMNAVLSLPDSGLQLFGVPYSFNVTINEDDCHVGGQQNYDALDWIVAGILLFFLLLASFCTTVDYFFISRNIIGRQSLPLEEVVLSFSVYANGRKLLDTKYPEDAMTSLNGMKVFSIAWVVLGHRYRFLINQPLVNLLDFPEEVKKWQKMIIFSGPLSVDTFFLISGLLNMYVFAVTREKIRRFTPVETLMGYLHRYLRLTPCYLVMIAISATWLYRLGDGPYWDRMVGPVRDNCRNYFWENLVYLNNYLNPDNYCMMQSWYLSADMQMFWLSPFVIYPLWRWPIFGFLLLGLLTVASILTPILVSYFFYIRSPIPLTTDAVKASHEMAYLYLPTHTKTVSYVLGIMAGYLLYNLRRDEIRFKPNKVVLTFLWLSSAVFMLYAVFGGYSVFQRDDNYDRVYSAFYIGFYRFFWSLGLVWVIIACTRGHGGPVSKLLSWPPLGPLARLTYCVYLTHVAVILRGAASQRTPVYFNDYNQVELYLGDLVISIGAAAVLSLLFEAPMMRIEKLIFSGGCKKRPRPRVPPEVNREHQA